MTDDIAALQKQIEATSSKLSDVQSSFTNWLNFKKVLDDLGGEMEAKENHKPVKYERHDAAIGRAFHMYNVNLSKELDDLINLLRRLQNRLLVAYESELRRLA